MVLSAGYHCVHVQFPPQFLTVHDGCCLHEAHAFAAVGLAKYSSHESRYPSSVTLRSDGRSLPLRLINLQYKSWTSLGYCASFCHVHSTIVIRNKDSLKKTKRGAVNIHAVSAAKRAIPRRSGLRRFLCMPPSLRMSILCFQCSILVFLHGSGYGLGRAPD